MKRLPSVVWLLILLSPTAVAAQAPTFQQTVSLREVRSPALSPDGKLVAYAVDEADWQENTYRTQLWIAATAGGERYQLTNAKKSSQQPQWSPDGQRLALLSDRDGKTQ